MTKKETEIRELFNTYIEENSKATVAATLAKEAKAKLMQLIPENETLFDVHYTCTDKQTVDNALYIKKLFEFIPKTKRDLAKALKDDCKKTSKYTKIAPAKPEKE